MISFQTNDISNYSYEHKNTRKDRRDWVIPPEGLSLVVPKIIYYLEHHPIGGIMIRRFLTALVIISSLSVLTVQAQVIHTLQSPNYDAGSRFGGSVAGIGDVNNDARGDFVVSATGEGPYDHAGLVYVLNGATGNIMHTLTSPNAENDGYFGIQVACAGDIDGNNVNEIIIGARWESPGSSPDYTGRAYIFSGTYGSPIRTLQSPNEEEWGYFGNSVACAGDVNGDGYDDVIVGAYNEDIINVDAGRAYVFSGLDGSLIHSLSSPFPIEDGYFGYSVAGAGDVNGDDKYDIIVGAYRENLGTTPNFSGAAYVFDGDTGDTLYSLISPSPDVNGYLE